MVYVMLTQGNSSGFSFDEELSLASGKRFTETLPAEEPPMKRFKPSVLDVSKPIDNLDAYGMGYLHPGHSKGPHANHVLNPSISPPGVQPDTQSIGYSLDPKPCKRRAKRRSPSGSNDPVFPCSVQNCPHGPFKRKCDLTYVFPSSNSRFA